MAMIFCLPVQHKLNCPYDRASSRQTRRHGNNVWLRLTIALVRPAQVRIIFRFAFFCRYRPKHPCRFFAQVV